MRNFKRMTLALLLVLLLLAAIPAVGQAPIEIQMWIAFTDHRLEWTVERAAEFNELYPEYNVVVAGYANYEELFTAAALAAESGTPPAIIHFFEAATQRARDAVNPANGEPLFKSVAEAIGDRTEINGVPVVLDDVVSAAANYYTIDGVFTSMPWNTSSAIMFSNKTILDAAGVTEIPTTWAEMEAACELIMAMEDGPENCATWPNYGWFFEQAVAQQGGLLANNDNGRAGRATEVFLNSPEMVAYVSWWKDMADKGFYTYTGAQRDWTGTYNMFVAQQAAFLIYSSSDSSNVTIDGEEAGFEVVASFNPHNQDVELQGYLIGGATLWLINGLDEATETGALMFMNWFNNPENAAAWHDLTGYIPITDTAVALLEEQGYYEENPNNLVASAQLNASQDTPATRGALIGSFVGMRDILTAATEDILVNDRDVVEALDEANAAANLQLEEYNFLFVEE